jgi:hypothetical protein
LARCPQGSAGEAQPGQSGTPTVITPSNAEAQEIAAATGRQHRQRPPRVAIDIEQHKNGPIEIFPTHLDAEGWKTRLQDALGTSSYDFVEMELR